MPFKERQVILDEPIPEVIVSAKFIDTIYANLGVVPAPGGGVYTPPLEPGGVGIVGDPGVPAANEPLEEVRVVAKKPSYWWRMSWRVLSALARLARGPGMGSVQDANSLLAHYIALGAANAVVNDRDNAVLDVPDMDYEAILPGGIKATAKSDPDNKGYTITYEAEPIPDAPDVPTPDIEPVPGEPHIFPDDDPANDPDYEPPNPAPMPPEPDPDFEEVPEPPLVPLYEPEFTPVDPPTAPGHNPAEPPEDHPTMIPGWDEDYDEDTEFEYPDWVKRYFDPDFDQRKRKLEPEFDRQFDVDMEPWYYPWEIGDRMYWRWYDQQRFGEGEYEEFTQPRPQEDTEVVSDPQINPDPAQDPYTNEAQEAKRRSRPWEDIASGIEPHVMTITFLMGKIVITNRQQPEPKMNYDWENKLRNDKKPKNFMYYRTIMYFISKTFGTAGELLDLYNAIKWNVKYKGTYLAQMSTDELLAIGSDPNENVAEHLEVDWEQLIIDVAAMQAMDKVIGTVMQGAADSWHGEAGQFTPLVR